MSEKQHLKHIFESLICMQSKKNIFYEEKTMLYEAVNIYFLGLYIMPNFQ